MVRVPFPGYEILHLLGTGLSGEVFKVRETASRRVQALKALRREIADPGIAFGFRHEYFLLKRLAHPHIVKVYELGEGEDRRLYFTMDYLKPVSLRRLFRRAGFKGLCRALIQICRTLEFSHRQGVLHGDIRPENILSLRGAETSDPHLVLTDFGLARSLGCHERDVVGGTMAYLAPEQLMGWPLDGRTDLFSLGAVLHQSLSGRLPFPARNHAQYLKAVMETKPTSPRELAPEVPPALAKLVEDLLSRDPAGRPNSARETAHRLAVAAGLEGIQAEADRYLPVRTPRLAGRERELRILRESCDQALSGKGKVLLISGEGGIGKSRLLEEMAREASVAGHLVVQGEAPFAEGGSAFGLLRNLRRRGRPLDLLSGAETDGSAGRPAGTHLAVEMDPEARERLHDHLATLLLEGGTGGGGPDAPTIVILDELERCDQDTLRFLPYLARLVEGRGVLLCLGAGDEFEGWIHHELPAEAEKLHLEPLGPAGIRELIEALLAGGGEGDGGRDRIPRGRESLRELDLLAGWLEEKVGGNPELLERSLRELERGQILKAVGDGWRVDADRLDRFTPFRSLRARAEETLAALPPHDRAILGAAALLGPSFDASFLPPIVEAEEAELVDRLHSLESRGLLVPEEGRPSGYAFRDRTLWSSLRHGIPSRRLRALSSRVVSQLETVAHDIEPGALGQLYLGAGRRVEAARAFGEAARRAREAKGLLEAARNYRLAWDSLPRDLRRRNLRLACEWAEVLVADGDFERALEVANTGLGFRADGKDGEETRHRLLFLKGRALRKRGEMGGARRAFTPLITRTVSKGLPSLRAEALAELGWVEMVEGNAARATKLLSEARELARRRRRPAVAALAELRLGVQAWREPDFAEALARYEQCWRSLSETAEVPLAGAVLENVGLCLWNLLRLAEARRLLTQAVARHEKWHNRRSVARSCLNLAGLLMDLGEWKEARRNLQRAEEWLRPLDDRRLGMFLLYWQTRLALLGGSLNRARELARVLGQEARSLSDSFTERGFLAIQAEVALAGGDTERAQEIAERALTLARQAKDRWCEVENRLVLGLAAMRAGKRQVARELEKAVVMAEEVAPARETFRARLALAVAWAREGANRRAMELLVQGAGEAEKSRSPLWRAEQTLAQGRVALEGGKHEEACRAFAAADATFVDLGAQLYHLESLTHLARARWQLGNRRAARKAHESAATLAQTIGAPWEEHPGEFVAEDSGPEVTAAAGRWRESLLAMGRVLTELTVLQELPDVLTRALDIAIAHMGAERGVVALVDSQTGEPRVSVARNMARENLSDLEDVSRTVLRRAGGEGRPLYCGDALADPELSRHDSVRRSRTRTMLCQPLVYHGRVLGTIYVDHREIPDLFGEEELMFFRQLADVAAVAIRNAERFALRESQVRRLRGAMENKLVFEGTVGGSPAMQQVLRRLTRAATTSVPVLLRGETGVGKDHLALLFHRVSGRSGKFVTYSLADIPESLAESELFGIEDNAATGVVGKAGWLEAADGGTLLLNEVGDMPVGLQVKLLGFFDTGRIPKVGLRSKAEGRPVSARVVCATNRELETLVKEGKFRKDLFYRISGFTIEIPPLRERPEDIAELADFHLARIAAREGKEGLVLSPEAMRLLGRCSWEGNVREIETCLERAVVMAEGEIIGPEDLDSWSLRELRQAARGRGKGDVREEMDLTLFRRLREALIRSGGIMSAAGEELGVTEGAVRKWVKKFKLEHLALRRHRKE